MKLLIIDGNRERRLSLKRIFQDDFSVTTLSSAQEAIAFARSHIFEVIIISETINSHITPASLLQTLNESNTQYYFIAFLLSSTEHLSTENRLAGFNDVITLNTPAHDLYKKVVISAGMHY
jgi:CheY-like chemotaxis protein